MDWVGNGLGKYQMKCARIDIWPGKAPPGMRLQTLVSWVLWNARQINKDTEGISVQQLRNKQGKPIHYDERVTAEEYEEDETPWSCGVTWQVHADDATEAMQTAEQRLVSRFPTFTGELE